MKTSVLVSAGVFAALAAAMVLAAPMSSRSEGGLAQVPNRAEVFLAATCGAVTPVTVADQQAWHDALGSKRALDRDLFLAAGTSGLLQGCAPAKG